MWRSAWDCDVWRSEDVECGIVPRKEWKSEGWSRVARVLLTRLSEWFCRNEASCLPSLCCWRKCICRCLRTHKEYCTGWTRARLTGRKFRFLLKRVDFIAWGKFTWSTETFNSEGLQIGFGHVPLIGISQRTEATLRASRKDFKKNFIWRRK